MTPADFVAAFPAFRDEQVPTIQRHLNASAPFFDVARWGAFYDEGLGCWIAHRLTVENAHGESKNETAIKGDVTTEEAGGISTTRSSELLTMATKNPYLRTTYGQRYHYLARQVGLGGAVV